MTIAAFKVRCMACFSFLIFTFFGVVMATVAGIEVGAARETNSAMALVMLTKPQRLSSNWFLLLRPSSGFL